MSYASQFQGLDDGRMPWSKCLGPCQVEAAPASLKQRVCRPAREPGLPVYSQDIEDPPGHGVGIWNIEDALTALYEGKACQGSVAARTVARIAG